MADLPWYESTPRTGKRDIYLKNAADCREKAKIDPAGADYWTDQATNWRQLAVEIRGDEAITYEVRAAYDPQTRKVRRPQLAISFTFKKRVWLLLSAKTEAGAVACECVLVAPRAHGSLVQAYENRGGRGVSKASNFEPGRPPDITGGLSFQS